jgi:hypothetical protein
MTGTGIVSFGAPGIEMVTGFVGTVITGLVGAPLGARGACIVERMMTGA